jgi:hypothetical protein
LEGLEVTRDEQRVFKLLSSGDQKFKRSLKKDWISTPGWLNRLKYIRDMLLPSTSYVAAKYNISRPWMALLFYPYRWCLILLKLLTS